MKITHRALLIVCTLVFLVPALTGCSTPSAERAEAANDTTTKLVLYFSNAEASELVSEERTVAKTDNAPEMVVLEELFKGPQKSGSMNTLPARSEVLVVEVREGVAFVDLSQSTVDNHSGGSAADLMSVSSIVYSLTELSGIDEVQFLLEGKVVDSLFGHVDTSKPISR